MIFGAAMITSAKRREVNPEININREWRKVKGEDRFTAIFIIFGLDNYQDPVR